MSDELDGIFDDLKPEDFFLETSAIEEVSRTSKGAEMFSAFVDEQLRAIRLAYAASQGQVNPIAILANTERQRVFSPEDDENMGQYTSRLNREAKLMGATWVFISRKTLVAAHHVSPDQIHDTNDPEAVAQAIADGVLKTGLIWFSERRENGERHRRHGIIEALPNHNLGQPVEGDSSQAIPIFDRILA